MIANAAEYRAGHRVADAPDLHRALQRCRDHGGFVWIGLVEPDATEFADVAAHLGLHPLAVEDAIKAHQRPKLEHYGDTVFLVLKPAQFNPDTTEIDLSQIMVFAGPHFVVTVRHGTSTSLAITRDDLEGEPQRMARGPLAVVHAIADVVVDDYMPIARQLAIAVDDIEHAVFSGPKPTHAERISRLKRETLEFHWAVDPLVGPLETFADGSLVMNDDDLRPYFRDVHDHLLRLTAQLRVVDNLLDATLSANVAQVGMRQNEDMRKISAWVAIVAVPTLIAGIYGMNFENMPELGWAGGYPFALGLMALSAVLLYRNFKQRDWL